MNENKENGLNYQKVIFNSIICTNKECRKKRIFIKRNEEQLKINKISGELYNYQCECGNNILFKY